MSEWQPIKTAPHDEYILVCCPHVIGGYTVFQGCWYHCDDSDEGWVDMSGNEISPTHWMPIPVVPKDAA